MNTKEILTAVRYDKLDDVKGYGEDLELWKDEELLRYLNTVLNEWCRQTLCLRDSSTEAICKITLLANQHTYPMDSRIIAVFKGRLTSGFPNIEVKDELWLNDNIYSWETRTGVPRYLVPDYEVGKLRIIPYYGSEGYFSGEMTFTASDKRISMTGAMFSNYLKPNDKVVISGTDNNNGTKTVITVETSFFTISETVTNETAPKTVVQKVMDALWLSVSRLPLAPLTLANWENEFPEINFDYHPKLIDGVLREAYLKQDTETYDPKASERHGAKFEISKALAKKEKYRLRHSNRILKPHRGMI